jgi:hypothetical protein
VFVLAAMLLASSSLCSFAQEPGKAPAAAPQAGAPAQTDQNAPPPPDQKAGREQQKSDNREMGPDWKMRRSDGDRTGRDDREMGHGGMMHRGDGDRMGRDDRETGHGGMMHRGDGDRMGRDDRETGHGGMMRRGDGDRMGYDRDKDRRYHERGERYGRCRPGKTNGICRRALPRRAKSASSMTMAKNIAATGSGAGGDLAAGADGSAATETAAPPTSLFLISRKALAAGSR